MPRYGDRSPIADEEEQARDEVMSEVHVGCPPDFSGPYISRFTFPFPFSSTDKLNGGHKNHLQGEGSTNLLLKVDGVGDLTVARRNSSSLVRSRAQSTEQIHRPVKDTSSQSLVFDKDGDLVITRQSGNYERCPICTLTIQHNITSSLSNVGLQVWMAALVLTDFILHKSSTSSDFNGITALELGAGTGLASLSLAPVAKKVFITGTDKKEKFGSDSVDMFLRTHDDRGIDILDNCATNARLNSTFLKYPETIVHVKELDWKEQWPPNLQTCGSESQRSRYSWMPSEIEEAEGATVLLAADVIYSDELTDSFFSILERLMSRGSEKVLYLALEKRYNFSLDDLDIVANGYARFRNFLKDDKECRTFDDSCFEGEQIDLDNIPQYIREYERGKDVELWKITYCSKKLGRRLHSSYDVITGEISAL